MRVKRGCGVREQAGGRREGARVWSKMAGDELGWKKKIGS